MKRGFTLVELLGVIVIITILTLLVFPSIMNSINGASKDVDELTMKMISEASKLYIEQNSYQYSNNKGDIYCISINKLVENGYLKSPIKIGDKDITNLKSVQVSVKDENKYALEDTNFCEEKRVYSQSVLNGSIPELNDKLVPVIYEDGSWKVANPYEKWYDYSAKEWANAVILSDKGKDKKVGDTLTLPTSPTDASNSDVMAMFVWIPRYSYTISSTAGSNKDNPGLIDIKFVNVDTKETGTATYTGDTPRNWYTHPAFTFGSEELSGIWVGKFETSAKADSICYSSASDTNCNNTTQDPYILPNVYSLRYQKVSNQFETAKKFNQNLNNALDSHMMKNSEWGAVAYLSHSEYGKEDEVYINNCSSYITGIGADSASDSSSATTCNDDANKYNGTSGVNASTTGNEYGIYDMSGGTYEYVMGVYNKTKGSSGFSDNLTGINEKYYDNYETTIATDYKGHALGETSKWYNDYANAYFVSSSSPWFTRGGAFYNTSDAGVFYFGSNSGVSYSDHSFRVVLAPAT